MAVRVAGTGAARWVEDGQPRRAWPVGFPSVEAVGRVVGSDLTPQKEGAPPRTWLSAAGARSTAACDPSRKTTPVPSTGSEVRTKPPREGRKAPRAWKSPARGPDEGARRSLGTGKTLRMGPDEQAGLGRVSQRPDAAKPRRAGTLFRRGNRGFSLGSRGRSAALPGGGVRPTGTGWAGARSGWQRLRRSAPVKAVRRSVESAGPLDIRSGGV